MVSLVFVPHHCTCYQQLWTGLLFFIVNIWNLRKTIFPSMVEMLEVRKVQSKIYSGLVRISMQLLHGYYSEIKYGENDGARLSDFLKVNY
jgi:hypothetical protein